MKLSTTGSTTCKGNMLNTVSTPVKCSGYKLATEKPRFATMGEHISPKLSPSELLELGHWTCLFQA